MKRAIIILLLISAALATALGAEKTDPKAVIGKINDKVYTYADYEAILTNYLNYYQKLQSTPLTAEDKAKFNDKCWEELVGRYIYDQAIKDRNLKCTTQELLAEAKKNPPASVKQIKDLTTNGKFDQKKYEKALGEAEQFRQAVLDDVREMYQYTKLLNTIRSEASADPDSVRQAWNREQDLIDAKIIFFDAGKLASVSATEEESRQFYNERKAEYRRENGRRYLYTRIAKAATAGDSLAVKERAWQLYRELQSGEDFAEAAKQWSQDPGSGKNGGELGWFGRGRMVKPFEDVAFTTPVGQIAEPVLSQFGWHIIQTTDRRMGTQGEEVSARHILLRVDPSEQTAQQMKSLTARLFALAGEKGLRSAAAELKLSAEETPAFQASEQFIKGIGRDANLISFAFANPEGAIPDIWYAPSGDAYVLEVSAVLPEYYISYEEQAQTIQAAATRSKRGYYMNEYVQNFVRNLKPEQYLDTADRDSVMVIALTGHKKGENITSVGKVEAVETALFETPAGSWAPLISEQMRWFLVRVDKHAQPDPVKWEKEKAGLLAQAKTDMQTKHLNDWYVQQRQKLSIIDNRLDYFDLSAARKTQQIKLGG